MPTIDSGLALNSTTAAERTTATGMRNALMALFQRGTGTAVQPGRIYGSRGDAGPLIPASASTSALLFTVTSGYAITVRTSAPALGGYLVGTRSDVQITLAAANASNPRIDAVYICQPDPEAGDTGRARIDVVTGVAAASPVAPADSALPQGSLRLGNITVPAGATAASACSIAITGAYEAGVNNTLPVHATLATLPTSAPLGALAIVQNPGAGMPGNITYRWIGSRWAIWDTEGSIEGTVVTRDGQVAYDNGPGQNSFTVRSGVVTWNFSYYDYSVARGNGQRWSTVAAGFRPIDGSFVGVTASYYDGNYGLCGLSLQNDGQLLMGIKNNNSGGGANTVRGTLTWRIS